MTVYKEVLPFVGYASLLYCEYPLNTVMLKYFHLANVNGTVSIASQELSMYMRCNNIINIIRRHVGGKIYTSKDRVKYENLTISFTNFIRRSCISIFD